MTINNSEVLNNFVKIKQLDKFMTGHKGFIAGGVFKNIFNDEKYKDVDIFFENEEDYSEAVNYFNGNKDFEKSYFNKKVKAFKHKDTGVILELINYVYGKPMDIANKFDFTITKFVYFKEYSETKEDKNYKNESMDSLFEDVDELENEIEWKVAYDDKFFEHLHLKRLVINEESLPLRNPANTYNRSYRYAKYGYFPCLETKKTLISELINNKNFDIDDLGGELYNGLD